MPLAVKGGTTGAILTYQRFESGSVNLYAHRVVTTPTFAVDPIWPAGGVAVSTAPGTQGSGSTVVQDGSGGAIAVFMDTRDSLTTGIDIYAQRVLATGALPGSSTDVSPTSGPIEALRVRPNPLTTDAEVVFDLPSRSWVDLDVYDVVGRKTLRLLEGEHDAGSHRVRFSRWQTDLRDGVYYLRLTTKPVDRGPCRTTTRSIAVVR